MYIKYRFMHYHQTWYGTCIFHNCPIYFTVQYKINLNCMFKDFLYPTLRSFQNQNLDGRIMYLTSTLVPPNNS